MATETGVPANEERVMSQIPRTNMESVMHRALVRASRRADLLTREGAAVVLRELFDGELVYLKELPPRRVRRPTAKPSR